MLERKKQVLTEKRLKKQISTYQYLFVRKISKTDNTIQYILYVVLMCMTQYEDRCDQNVWNKMWSALRNFYIWTGAPHNPCQMKRL